MKETVSDKKKDFLDEKPLTGIKFITAPGTEYDYRLKYDARELSLRSAFNDRVDVKGVIEVARDFKNHHPNTFNGLLLGKPTFDIEDGQINITAEKLHYFIYFAYHNLRIRESNRGNEDYPVLSVCGLLYDKSRECFYLSKRPINSQEDPGKIDAPGGVLNPEVDNADPLITIKNRFKKKLGLEPDGIKCLGVERIFDKHYSLYNIAMYGEVDGIKPQVGQDLYTEIPLDKMGGFLLKEELTTPARATILLALGQKKFEHAGWGREKVENYLREHS